MNENATPMIKQYLKLKEEYPGCILFFRLGDFYEMFFEDAETAARELGITLTSRQAGGGEKAAMAGVPYHAVEGYIAQLIEKGYRVAICEQMEDPRQAKGIVSREVVRVISPGTLVEEELLAAGENNFLVTILKTENSWGLAYSDISTGEIGSTEIDINDTGTLWGEIARLQPRELYVCRDLLGDQTFREISSNLNNPLINSIEEDISVSQARKFLKDQFGVANLEGFGLEKKPTASKATAVLAEYLLHSQKRPLEYLRNIHYYNLEGYMVLDPHTRRNLEINRGLVHGSTRGSLVGILDRTKTAMGSRLVKKWINQPLLNIATIEARLDFVEELISKDKSRDQLAKMLGDVYDLERLLTKVGYGTANARDLVALQKSLVHLPEIKNILNSLDSGEYLLQGEELDDLSDLESLLSRALAAEPPLTLTEGGLICEGFNEELDNLRNEAKKARVWIANLENSERKRTGIKSLKVGYNKVFGYYLEVTRANLHLVPEEYVRKQTLANAERYFTPELKEKENQILGAEEKINALEYEIFTGLRDQVEKEMSRIQRVASILAALDVLLSFSRVALDRNYSRPELKNSREIKINKGRHPVVEAAMGEDSFVPNDTTMDGQENRFHLITGPNMAGKSTYLRQVALIVLMAQIGCFVPAEEARIGLVDRIFTRVGATDDLTRGKSTFLVEMNEVAQIINSASSRSLILLDEVGRGTSTYDGLSIAWAVTEYINNPNRIGARTLFATHYHELTVLDQKEKGLRNYNVAVEEQGEEVIFLHTIKEGSTDESYGIHVARLAGIPPEVLFRAKEILNSLEKKDHRVQPPPPRRVPLFPDSDRENMKKILKELSSIDFMEQSPLESLNQVHKLQKKAQKLINGDGKNGQN